MKILLLFLFVFIPVSEVQARASNPECVRGDAKMRIKTGKSEFLVCTFDGRSHEGKFSQPTTSHLLDFFRAFEHDPGFKYHVETVAEMKFDAVLNYLRGHSSEKTHRFDSKNINSIRYLIAQYRNVTKRSKGSPLRNMTNIINITAQNTRIIKSADESLNDTNCPIRRQLSIFRVEFTDGEVLNILPVIIKVPINTPFEHNDIFFIPAPFIRKGFFIPIEKRRLIFPSSGDITWVFRGSQFRINRQTGFELYGSTAALDFKKQSSPLTY